MPGTLVETLRAYNLLVMEEAERNDPYRDFRMIADVSPAELREWTGGQLLGVEQCPTGIDCGPAGGEIKFAAATGLPSILTPIEPDGMRGSADFGENTTVVRVKDGVMFVSEPEQRNDPTHTGGALVRVVAIGNNHFSNQTMLFNEAPQVIRDASEFATEVEQSRRFGALFQ